jgi:predicted nucleic acid-binding Zn ribbon protein
MKKIGDILQQYLKEMGWLTVSPYEPLFREWKKVAGESLAAHCRLVDVQDGMLLVEVDHPGWLQMLQLRKSALLEAARKAAPQGNIQGVRMRLGTGDH